MLGDSPVSSPRHKHLMKRKLPMKVFLDHIDPFGFPWLTVQLLTKQTTSVHLELKKNH